MHAFGADPANSRYTTRIHPALNSFTDKIRGTLVHLIGYVGMLALLAIGGIHLCDQLQDAIALEPSAKDSWARAGRSSPAFAISKFDLHDKTEVYEIFRHPGGGRKDVFHWSGADKIPLAELEIYRPGGELNESRPAAAKIATRMDAAGMGEREAAGIIDSKFGTVTLFRLPVGTDSARACLGFIKRVDEPNFRISGWSCQGDNLPARRAAIGCMLNRLILLTSGNDPKLAELFAHAELKRGDCTLSAAPALSADWVTGADNPRLRGAL